MAGNQSGRSFGGHVRALRLGYHWSERHGCYVRVRDVGEALAVDLCPAGSVPPADRQSGDHVRWWDRPGVLGLSRVLEDLAAGKWRLEAPRTLYLDDDGEEVKQ